MDDSLESLVRTPEMADVEDLPRTSSASGSVPPAMAPASHATVLSVPPATASSFVEPDDRVDSVGALPSPTLGDNSGNDSEKEHSADDPVEGNKEFVGSSLLTEDALKRMWKKCGFSWEIKAQISLEEEKPWSAPPGWVCLYSLSFLQSRLWFPLPQLLTSYATNRDVAISQMSLAAIRNMVIALVRGAEVDADVYVEFFEMFSQMNFTKDETFSVSIKTHCRLMDGRGPSKADGWQRKYFFLRISPASVVDSSAVFRTEWNPQPVGHGKHWPLPSWANDRLNRILGSEKISWSDFSVERVCRSIPLSWGVGSGLSLAAGSSNRKRDASHGIGFRSSLGESIGRCLFFSSDSDPGCHRLCRSCIDPPVSAVRSSPDEPVGDRERIPLVDSPHLGVPTTSLPAVSSCPDVLSGGDSGVAGAIEQFLFVIELYAASRGSDFLPGSKIRGNHLLGLYERKCKRLSDELELERLFLAEEKERSSSTSLSLKGLEENSSKLEVENRDLKVEVERLRGDVAERDCREKELLSQKSALEAEMTQLNESRTELVESERRRVESVMSARFGGFVEKVRKYMSNRDVVRPQVLAETQLSGVFSCLKLFIEEGIPIPAEKLAENEQPLLVQSAALDQMDVHDLELSDLPSFSLD
ncbi:uncharacterized protein LOC106384330 [Brassica napus]|uniref:uncharacterized protein LOC106384330 n=1 Tax=Brassica napus TaxID=3708 RepID=UPI0006AB3C63|nr:uncharacterized protein LOC106384330 [Brassica napus]